jgi:hypothetical protein
MRIKLLKKMYRQTNDAIKRGDLFQQRPCPFYNEMHRIFSGIEESNTSNSQSLLNDEDDDEDDLENENNIQLEDLNQSTNEDKLTQAVERLIEYQKQNEVN